MSSRVALLLVCLLGLATARAEETVTLTDGRTLSGTLVAEDAQQIILKQSDGEQRAILKSRVASIARATPAKPPVKEPAPTKSMAGAPTLETPADRMSKIGELGSPRPEVRARALTTVQNEKETLLPLMLGMLHPKQPTDEYTRIGILRALQECQPLNDQAAATLGYAALHDPYPEARREACQTIRALGDDRSLREIMKYAGTQNAAQRHAVAAALHEIDDPRMLLALIRALPQPSVTSNTPQESVRGLDKPAYQLPTGPGGVSIPIFLPQGETSAIATDLDSPATHLLKQIAGKDLGNQHYGWFNWYREKIGESGKAERDSSSERRSMRDRMNR